MAYREHTGPLTVNAEYAHTEPLTVNTAYGQAYRTGPGRETEVHTH